MRCGSAGFFDAGKPAASGAQAARAAGALGVAVFGTLLTALPSFEDGARAALVIAAVLSLLAALAWASLARGRKQRPAIS